MLHGLCYLRSNHSGVSLVLCIMSTYVSNFERVMLILGKWCMKWVVVERFVMRLVSTREKQGSDCDS